MLLAASSLAFARGRVLNEHRQVGMCLKYLPDVSDQPDARYNSATVPWQRVINAKGEISVR